jgi:hypothetical protein
MTGNVAVISCDAHGETRNIGPFRWRVSFGKISPPVAEVNANSERLIKVNQYWKRNHGRVDKCDASSLSVACPGDEQRQTSAAAARSFVARGQTANIEA